MPHNITAHSEEKLEIWPQTIDVSDGISFAGGNISKNKKKINSNNDIQSLLPQTTILPVVNNYVEPTPIQEHPTGTQAVIITAPSILGTPDNNVKTIDKNTVQTQGQSTIAGGNGDSIPDGFPDYIDANSQLSDTINTTTVGDALIGSGIRQPKGYNKPVSTDSSVGVLSEPTKEPLQNNQTLSSFINSNPIISAAVAAVVFIIVARMMGGTQ